MLHADSTCVNIHEVVLRETVTSREREALARLLASGAFSRAPNLERILIYLCEKHFSGEGHQVKEFHLATEVLGRPETFDPKKDSIVRVELHRLRKRLKDYYEKTPTEPIRILLPEKTYVPEFQVLEAALEVPVIVPAIAETVEVPGSQAKKARSPLIAPAVVAAVIASILLAWMVVRRSPANTFEKSVESAGITSLPDTTPLPVTAVAPPTGPEIRILAGHPPGNYVDHHGKTWSGDVYFTGGEAVNITTEIRTRGWDANLFSAMREGNFGYDIPLQPGSYELTILFVETAYGEGRPLGVESRRVFSVLANERPLLDQFDVLSESLDPNTAWTRVFKDISPAPDGKLHLKFSRSSGGKAFVNAIWLRPGTPGRLRPLRMVCRQQTYRDSNDVLWDPDHYFHGGTQITRPHGAPSGDQFQGERFGHFSYEIPVAKGKYAARLYFWEYWWGPNQPGKGGVGSRLFDVFCNHKPLLLDFDIIRRSPRDQTAVETFHGLEPDVRGVLALDFVPKNNFALINAIEILDESK